MGHDDELQWGPDAGAPIPPPPPPPLDLEVTVVRRGGGRGRLAVGAVAVVALVAGGLALVSNLGDDPSADASLAAAKAVVEDSESYRFELLEVAHVSLGDPDGAGSDTTTRSLTTGTVAAPDRWHVAQDYGMDFGPEVEPYGTIRVGDTMYTSADLMLQGEGEGPAWVEAPIGDMEVSADDLAEMYGGMEDPGLGDIPDEFNDESRLQLVMMAYLYELDGQPSSVRHLITDATDPTVEQVLGTGGVRLRTKLAPLKALADASDEPIPVVDLVLELDADDHPTLARFTAEAGSASADVEVQFSDWGAAITVDPPADTDIDHTPWIAEEELETVDPSLLVAPSQPPASMSLVGVTVFSMDMYEDGESDDDCRTVDLGYGTEQDLAFDVQGAEEMSEAEMNAYFDDMQYLNLTISPQSCAMEMDSTEFDSELGGFPARGMDEYWEVDLGEVVVQINSNLEKDEVAALVATIAPVTVEQLASSIPEWAQQTMYGMGGFGFGGPGMASLGWSSGPP